MNRLENSWRCVCSLEVNWPIQTKPMHNLICFLSFSHTHTQTQSCQKLIQAWASLIQTTGLHFFLINKKQKETRPTALCGLRNWRPNQSWCVLLLLIILSYFFFSLSLSTSFDSSLASDSTHVTIWWCLAYALFCHF